MQHLWPYAYNVQQASNPPRAQAISPCYPQLDK